MLNTDDAAYHRIFTEDEYDGFFRRFVNRFFSLDFFRNFYKDAVCPEIMPGYFASAATIYRVWDEKPAPKESLEDLAQETAVLFLNGLDGYSRMKP